MYRRSLGIDTTAHGHAGLATIFHRTHQLREAAFHYTEAIKINPNFVECHTNLGHVYRELGDLNSARTAFLNAVTVNPNSADDFNNLACVCKDLGALLFCFAFCFWALARFLSVCFFGSVYKLECQLHFPLSRANMTTTFPHSLHATLLLDAGIVQEAIRYYKASLHLKSDNPTVFCNLAHSLQMVCDWTDYENRMRQLVSLINHQVNNSQFPSVHPHHSFLYPLPNTLRRAIAAAHGSAAKRNVAGLKRPPYSFHDFVPLRGRIRVGFVSSDFKDHPTSHLMQSVPGYHNKELVEVFCYSLAPDDGSIYRKKIEREVEHFVDLSSITDNGLAAGTIARSPSPPSKKTNIQTPCAFVMGYTVWLGLCRYVLGPS